MLDLLETLPEEADDFAASVSDRVNDMAEWIESKRHVTDRQWEALGRMRDGAERWLERE